MFIRLLFVEVKKNIYLFIIFVSNVKCNMNFLWAKNLIASSCKPLKSANELKKPTTLDIHPSIKTYFTCFYLSLLNLFRQTVTFWEIYFPLQTVFIWFDCTIDQRRLLGKCKYNLFLECWCVQKPMFTNLKHFLWRRHLSPLNWTNWCSPKITNGS